MKLMNKLGFAAGFAADWTAKLVAPLVLAGAAAGFLAPEASSAAVPKESFPWLLGAIMFGMGLTLKGRDFAPVIARPKDVAVGAAAQFIIMPALAFGFAKMFALPPELALGMVLVGACPGGTASNVISFLARGNLALSVTMTAVSTLLAPLMTPALVLLWGGRSVDIPAAGMFLSILKIVIAPIAAGVLINEAMPRFTNAVKRFMPAFSTLAIAAIVAGIVAVNAGNVKGHIGAVAAAVALHNVCGMCLGWLVAAKCGMDVARRKTLAVEVGMQNSGLAVALATMHFAASPLVAVPGALFSVWHNLSGAVFAAVARRTRCVRS